MVVQMYALRCGGELGSFSISRNNFLRAISALANIILNLHSRKSSADIIDASTAR